METQNKISRRCDIFNIDVNGAFVKHLNLKKHLENEKVTPKNFLNGGDTSNTTKQEISNPKPLKVLARENITVDDEELNEEIVKK